MANYNSSFSGEQIDTLLTKIQNIIDIVYPIGSIYMSVNSTSPASFIGGTWARIQDTFLLSAGSNYIAGSTGGEATHQLTVDEMPSHTHDYYFDANANIDWYLGLTGGAVDADHSAIASGPAGRSYTMAIRNTGGDGSHNNMPPYLAVYVWKRIA